MKDLLKTTIIGGLLFLLPFALVLIVLDRALRSALDVVRPILDSLGLAELGFTGLGISILLVMLVLILVSFLAGMVARTTLGHRICGWFENTLLGGDPHYRMFKSMAEGFVHLEGADDLRPALVSIDGGWQVGYLVEELKGGWLAIFLPQAPSPLSGTLMYLPADRVRHLDITMAQTVGIVKQIGTGSGEALRGVDLTPTAGQVRK